MPADKKIYQIKVSLVGIKPPIWRRFLVPEKTTLDQLHYILQIVMGWEDYHLHMFTINGQDYCDPQQDPDEELGAGDEAQINLRQIAEGSDFSYKYDFGDGWQHKLTIEKILPAGKGVRFPRCVAGKRACPPEDVGGTGGYAEFLQAIADPKHPDYSVYLEWAAGFDPEYFDLEQINELLAK